MAFCRMPFWLSVCGCFIRRCWAGQQGTSGNQAVQVDMSAEILSPGMQDRCHAQFTVQAFFVCGKGFQCVPCRCKQTRVYDIIMALHPGVQLMGQGENQMVVRYGQQFFLLCLTPLSGGFLLALGTVTITT